jgi:hypothetical protein
MDPGGSITNAELFHLPLSQIRSGIYRNNLPAILIDDIFSSVQ